MRQEWKLISFFLAVVVIVIVLALIGIHRAGGKASSADPCVRHQLSIGGHYSAAGIVAALNAYPKQYNGPDTAPSVNEIERAREACLQQ